MAYEDDYNKPSGFYQSHTDTIKNTWYARGLGTRYEEVYREAVREVRNHSDWNKCFCHLPPQSFYSIGRTQWQRHSPGSISIWWRSGTIRWSRQSDSYRSSWSPWKQGFHTHKQWTAVHHPALWVGIWELWQHGPAKPKHYWGIWWRVRHTSDLGGLQASSSNLWYAQFAQFDKTVSNQHAQYGRMPSCQIDQFSGTKYSGETGGSTAIGYTIPGTNVGRGYETRSNAKNCTGAGFNSRSQPCICEERSRVQNRKGFDCLRVRKWLKDNFSL